jgi:hypothetical protein
MKREQVPKFLARKEVEIPLSPRRAPRLALSRKRSEFGGI